MQRLLPNVQAIYHAYASFHSGAAALSDVIENMDVTSDTEYPIAKGKLKFDNEVFGRRLVSYAKDNRILKGVNLKIKKGDKITLLVSGSAKAHFDILMGLLEPECGKILLIIRL